MVQTQGHLSLPTELLYTEMGISSLQEATRNPEGTKITGEPPEAFPGRTCPSGPDPKPRRDGKPQREVPAEMGSTPHRPRWGAPEQPQLPRQKQQAEED